MAGSGCPGVHTPAGRDRHADHEATRPGTPPGTATGQPSPARAPLAHGAWPQACQALLRRHRPALTVEGGHPRSNDGTQLCPAQRPRAPHALAAEGGSGRNAIIIRLLKKKGFQKEAGRTNRVVRPGCVHAPLEANKSLVEEAQAAMKGLKGGALEGRLWTVNAARLRAEQRSWADGERPRRPRGEGEDERPVGAGGQRPFLRRTR